MVDENSGEIADATPLAFIPSADNKALYQKFRDDMIEIKAKNQELYDQNLLTLSSAGLGLSMAFIKDIVKVVSYKPMLMCSWAFFGGAILSTLISLLLGPYLSEMRIADAEAYYLEGKQEYFNRKAWTYSIVEFLNWFSGLLFVVGIVLTIIFCSLNICSQPTEDNMAKEDVPVPRVQKDVIRLDGLTGAEMQKSTGVDRTGERALLGGSMQQGTTQHNSTTGQGSVGDLMSAQGGLTGPRMQQAQDVPPASTKPTSSSAEPKE